MHRRAAIALAFRQVRLLGRRIETLREEAKKTSIHFVRKTGFAGVHPRKAYLILNIRLDHALESPRVAKSEQVSKNRWHHEFRLERPAQVDGERLGLLRDAFELSG